jgi:hypothetical protein
MLWHGEITILAAKGNMPNNEIQNENKSTPSIETCGTLFEIRVRRRISIRFGRSGWKA